MFKMSWRMAAVARRYFIFSPVLFAKERPLEAPKASAQPPVGCTATAVGYSPTAFGLQPPSVPPQLPSVTARI